MPARNSIFFLALFILIMAGCAPSSSLWGETAPSAYYPDIPQPTDIPFTATATQTETPTPTSEPTGTPTLTPTITLTPTALPPSMQIQRVIIISFDGLRADAVNMVPMTNLQAIMRESAYSLTARTINYAVTLPGHASMLSGSCQSKHGVWWDTTMWYKGYAKGVDIFDLAHAANLRTVMVVNKEKMRQLAEPETTDVYKLIYGQEPTIMQAAIDEFANGFDLMFIHFGSPDNRGHKYGWMSGTYFKALRAIDGTLPQLLAALDEYNMRDSTLIIFTADHGGHDKGHVGNVLEDLQIPWIAYGPGIQPQELPNPVSVMDTGPTAAYALELPIQPEWDGHPVYEAFGLPALDIHPANYRICK